VPVRALFRAAIDCYIRGFIAIASVTPELRAGRVSAAMAPLRTVLAAALARLDIASAELRMPLGLRMKTQKLVLIICPDPLVQYDC
jgi:hypothetical protein